MSAFIVQVTDDEQGYSDIAQFGPFLSKNTAERWADRLSSAVAARHLAVWDSVAEAEDRLNQISISVVQIEPASSMARAMQVLNETYGVL